MAGGDSNHSSPLLGAQAPRGDEPLLSQARQAQRRAQVADLLERLYQPMVHKRYDAVLTLAEYAEIPRAVGGIVRSLRDESVLVRLAAILAITEIGPRLANPLLCGHAIHHLAAMLADPQAYISTLAAETLMALGGAVHPRVAALAEEAHARREAIIPFSHLAAEALERIGTPEALAALAEWPDLSR